MNLTSILPTLNEMLLKQETFVSIDTDSMLSVKRYPMTLKSGENVELCIANASKRLFAPTQIHHMLAKGIVYTRTTSDSGFNYALVAMPYSKIYNSFESVALSDSETISNEEGLVTSIVRKYDGTLIARWIFDGQVYFSTRGRIISLEENEFYDLTIKVIEDNNYSELLDPRVFVGCTVVGELVGPSNVILEKHPKDDMYITGINSLKYENGVLVDVSSYDPTDYEDFTTTYPNLKYSEVYDDKGSIEEILGSFETIQEGVILVYKDLYTRKVVARIKYKSADYISLLKKMRYAEVIDVLDVALEKGMSSWGDFEAYFMNNYPDMDYREEILEGYKEEWVKVYNLLIEVYSTANALMHTAIIATRLQNRKERFFFVQECVGKEYAGIVMGLLDGKRTDKDVIKAVAKTLR